MYLDLHVHLRGTISPSLARQLADQTNPALIPAISGTQPFVWSDFGDFLRLYDEVGSVVQNATDLEEVAYRYLATSAAAGTIYVEFMLSPPDLVRSGIAYSDQLAALSTAWERSRTQYGIESRLIVTCVRQLGPEAATQAALQAASCPHPYVVGFGMTGDERQFEISDFAPAFQIAREAGLRLTAHAGEHRDASTVREAIERLHLDRVGHGIRAVEDPSVMSLLAQERIGLEVCISSNIALGLSASLAGHPLSQIMNSHVQVSLGTDDPGFFNTSPEQEYKLAGKICDLDQKGLQDISRNAINMSFCDDNTKILLQDRLKSYSNSALS